MFWIEHRQLVHGLIHLNEKVSVQLFCLHPALGKQGDAGPEVRPQLSCIWKRNRVVFPRRNLFFPCLTAYRDLTPSSNKNRSITSAPLSKHGIVSCSKQLPTGAAGTQCSGRSAVRCRCRGLAPWQVWALRLLPGPLQFQGDRSPGPVSCPPTPFTALPHCSPSHGMAQHSSPS